MPNSCTTFPEIIINKAVIVSVVLQEKHGLHSRQADEEPSNRIFPLKWTTLVEYLERSEPGSFRSLRDMQRSFGHKSRDTSHLLSFVRSHLPTLLSAVSLDYSKATGEIGPREFSLLRWFFSLKNLGFASLFFSLDVFSIHPGTNLYYWKLRHRVCLEVIRRRRLQK